MTFCLALLFKRASCIHDFWFIISQRWQHFPTSHHNWHLKIIWAIRTHLQAFSIPDRMFAAVLIYKKQKTENRRFYNTKIPVSDNFLELYSVSSLFCELLQHNHFCVWVCMCAEQNISGKMPFAMSQLAHILLSVMSFPAFFHLRGCNREILPFLQTWEQGRALQWKAIKK